MSSFGPTRAVVLKFMINEEQWRREIELRKVLDTKIVVSLLGAYGPSDECFSSSIASVTLYDGKPLASYPLYIVMLAADRSLDEIFNKERPEEDQIRHMMKDTALAVQVCHKKGIVHGDLKMLNVLRISNSIKLIDMDASAVLERDYAGAKFSSGILPPEMFFELKTKAQEEQYLRYWSKERETNGELWQTKLRPLEYRNGYVSRTFVVKTFRASPAASANQGEAAELKDLPYTPVIASTSLDMWSFGLILFNALAGVSLLPVNRDDDLKSSESVEKAASWTDAELDVAIHEFVSNKYSPSAVDLLSHLLRVKPGDRYQSMAEVLAHPFITGISADRELLRGMAAKIDELNERTKDIDARTKFIQDLAKKIDQRTVKLEQLSIKTLARIEKAEAVLLRGMIEAADVMVPSCFIIVNQQLDLPVEYVKAQAIKEKQEAVKLDEYQQAKANKTGRLLGFFNKVTENVSKGLAAVKDKLDIDSISALAADPLSICDGDDFWLYLIDEHTMQPVVPLPGANSCYPIPIKTPNEFVPKYMPYMKLALSAMSIYNGAAGLAQSLGYPVPTIPASVTASAESAVVKLDHKSSVDAFDVLQGSLDTLNVDAKVLAELKADFKLIFPWQCSCSWNNDTEENAFKCQQCAEKNKSYDEEAAKAIKKRLKEVLESTEKKTVRGKGLFDFQKFLLEHDAQNTFCDLRRVMSPSGKTIWCSSASVEAIESEALLEQAWGEREWEGETIKEELKQQLAEHKRQNQELMRRLALYAPIDA